MKFIIEPALNDFIDTGKFYNLFYWNERRICWDWWKSADTKEELKESAKELQKHMSTVEYFEL